MNHPLDGARLKVVWAQKDLKSLKDEVARYLASNSYEFVTESDANNKTARLVIKTEPPLDLSHLIGQCANGLRASLDYIVWQLAIRYSPKAPEVGKDRIYFPLQKDSATFNANALAKYSIPANAIGAIESVQPYQAGYERLAAIPDLTNEDRHRLPLLTLARVSGTSIRFRDDKGKTIFGIVGAVVGEGFTGHLSGAGIALNALGTSQPALSPENVKVEAQATVFVAFQNSVMPREPVDRTLEQMVECVARVVPRFDSFFSS